MNIPVITIDGPSGAGKGTIAQQLAKRLGYRLLDSGAVYRAAAVHALRSGADLDDETSVMLAMDTLEARFKPSPSGIQVFLADLDITAELRSETTAAAASRVAVMPLVRESLLDEQRSFRTAPGLVADGRDMGTVVFPDATLKVFLSAAAKVRAERRAKQLKDKGIETTMPGLLQEIEARDQRDSTRAHSPLKAAEGALVIDSSKLTISDVLNEIIAALPEYVCVT